MAEGFRRTCRVYFASIVLLSLKPLVVAELIALSVFVPTLKLVEREGIEPPRTLGRQGYSLQRFHLRSISPLKIKKVVDY